MGGASSPIVAASSDLEVEVGVIRESWMAGSFGPSHCALGVKRSGYFRAFWQHGQRTNWRRGPSAILAPRRKRSEVKNSLGTPRLFLQRVRRGLKRRGLSCRARQKSEGKSKRAVDKRRWGA